jgi:hypothetical protein
LQLPSVLKETICITFWSTFVVSSRRSLSTFRDTSFRRWTIHQRILAKCRL